MPLAVGPPQVWARNMEVAMVSRSRPGGWIGLCLAKLRLMMAVSDHLALLANAAENNDFDAKLETILTNQNS